MSFDMVTVRVGEVGAAVDIPVYRDQLSAVSPYFRGAFKGSFKEATDRNLRLTDVSEQTFRIYLQWANVQVNSQSGGGSMTAPETLLRKPTTKFAKNPITIPAIDEEGYFDKIDFDVDELFRMNLEWQDDYRLLRVSFLRLYVFADKYDIPQFRDDIMTALISHSRTWEWISSPHQDLIEFAYANLPQSSKFIRFLVLSTAIWHADPLLQDTTRVLHELKEMHRDFAFEVAIVQVEKYRDKVFQKKKERDPRPKWEEALPHSCALHEHRVQDKKQCRERICNHPYIFNTLIDACVQDASGMKEALWSTLGHAKNDGQIGVKGPRLYASL
ncbi:hypothetical protein B0T12DRAFT_421148 [Alternaria alternata]|nr:hypothetical protein B0T12DRAFT_421148 [Alternaria alternata]